MIVYVFIIFLLLILSFVYDFSKASKGKSGWGYIVLIILILLAGFRGDIGNDTMAYHRWYDSLSSNPILAIRDSRFEPLFVLLCSFARSINCSWLLVQLFLATWINCYIFSFIKKYGRLLFLPILLYFISVYYFLNCEEIRGAVSFGFVLISLPYIEKKKYLKFILFVLLGCGFHYSCALFLILPFIPNMFKNKLLLSLVLIGGFWGAQILQAKFGVYALIIDNLLGIETVSSYVDSDYLDASGKSLKNLINIFITGVIFPLLSYSISKQKSESIRKAFTLYLLCVIGSMALPLFYRYNHQLSIINIVVLCMAISKALLTKRIFLKFTIALCFLIFTYVSLSVYLSYNSFLQGYFYDNFIPYSIYNF